MTEMNNILRAGTFPKSLERQPPARCSGQDGDVGAHRNSGGGSGKELGGQSEAPTHVHTSFISSRVLIFKTRPNCAIRKHNLFGGVMFLRCGFYDLKLTLISLCARGQLRKGGSVLPPRGSWRSKSGPPSGWQVPLPTEPACSLVGFY